MSRLYIFADEAGCFEFSRKPNASTYFIVCTITLRSCEMGNSLLALRRDMAWRKMPLRDYFHASEDKQAVRDEVYKLICDRAHEIEIQATIMEKPKAQPQVRPSKERFYQYGWYYHLRYVIPKLARPGDELLITTASVGTKKGQAHFTSAVNDVVQQTVRRNKWATTFAPSAADPCLQLADYCTWAIQRKWERKDPRPHKLIAHRITHEYDMWAHGTTLYY